MLYDFIYVCCPTWVESDFSCILISMKSNQLIAGSKEFAPKFNSTVKKYAIIYYEQVFSLRSVVEFFLVRTSLKNVYINFLTPIESMFFTFFLQFWVDF